MSGKNEDIKKGVFKTSLKPDTKLQLIAVRDIGRTVLHVFDNFDKYNGKTLDITGDELTQNEIAKILNCKVEYLDPNQLPKEEQTLYRWLETVGYKVNVEECKKCFPTSEDFKTWAEKKCGQKPEEQTHRA